MLHSVLRLSYVHDLPAPVVKKKRSCFAPVEINPPLVSDLIHCVKKLVPFFSYVKGNQQLLYLVLSNHLKKRSSLPFRHAVSSTIGIVRNCITLNQD